MKSPPNRPNMQITVSDFGPITEATVDLRPLTVFIGPSNTGKSYLAILIYALHRFFNGASAEAGIRSGVPQKFNFSPFNRVRRRQVDWTLDHYEAVWEWLKGLEHHSSSQSNCEEIPPQVATLFLDWLRPHKFWDELLPQELARCFGRENANWLVRHGQSSGSRFSFTNLNSGKKQKDTFLKYEFNLSNQTFHSDYSFSEDTVLRIGSDYADELTRILGLRELLIDPQTAPDLWEYLVSEMGGLAGATMVSPLSAPAYYLPADRTGVMHAHQVVVASMISSAPLAGLGQNVSLPRLSGVLSDFLVRLLSLGSHHLDDSEEFKRGLAKNIEDQMLLGAIHIASSDTSYPVFSYVPVGWQDKVPLMNASSMVSELAPIVLYLRHVTRPGDVLIIEEPESNLHPAMQVELIRQLAKVVNAGVRIILTTHSEWVLEELANLVQLSAIEDEKRPAALRERPALDPEDVGVWLFERPQNEDGSFVREIPLDEDEGGFASGFDRIARLTYNQWALIRNVVESEGQLGQPK